MSNMGTAEVTEWFIDKLMRTQTNLDFVNNINTKSAFNATEYS